MPLLIPDELLAQAGLTETEARIEIACRLYDAGVLEQPSAVRLAGIDRVHFWEELRRRGLPWVHIEDVDTAAELSVFSDRAR